MHKLLTAFLLVNSLVLGSCNNNSSTEPKDVVTQTTPPSRAPDISNAWVRLYAPYAQSDSDVCYSFDKLHQLRTHKKKLNQTRNIPSKHVKSITDFQKWYDALMIEDDFKTLPVSFEALLFETLIENDFDLNGPEARTFYSAITVPENIQLWWLQKNNQFLQDLVKNEELMAVAENWGDKPLSITGVGKDVTLMTKSHIEFIQTIVNKRIELFGLEKRPKVVIEYVKEDLNGGYYVNATFGNNTLTLNIGDRRHAINDPYQLIGTISHEIDHMLQNESITTDFDYITSLSDMATHGALARIYNANRKIGYYKSGKDYGFLTYLSNPVEKEAKRTSYQSSLFFKDRDEYDRFYHKTEARLRKQISLSTTYQDRIEKNGGSFCPRTIGPA